MGKNKEKKLTRAEKKKQQAELKAYKELKESFQQMLPIQEQKLSWFIDKEGQYHAAVVLGTFNPDLISEEKKRELVVGLHSALKGIKYNYSIIIVPVSLELKDWENNMLKQINIANQKRDYHVTNDMDHTFDDWCIEQLRTQLAFVKERLSNGEIVTKKALMLIHIPQSDTPKELADQAQKQVVSALRGAGNDAYIPEAKELRKCFKAMLNPTDVDLNRVPMTDSKYMTSEKSYLTEG